MIPQREPLADRRPRLSFQARLTMTLLAAALVPLAIFGVLLIVTGAVEPQVGSRLLLFVLAIAVAAGVLGGAAVARDLVAPLLEISDAVGRVSAGDGAGRSRSRATTCSRGLRRVTTASPPMRSDETSSSGSSSRRSNPPSRETAST